MNDLQKDQAIFQAMNEIANEVFNNACMFDGTLRQMVADHGGIVSLKDILSHRGEYFNKIYDAAYELYKKENPDAGYRDMKVREVCVDTFSCKFEETSVFELLDYWKSLAKVRGEIIFTYEETIDLPLITTVSVTLDNAANAKKLVKCCDKTGYRPALECVLAEVNLDTEVVSFVATDGHVLGVVTTDKVSVHRNNPNDKILRALFAPKDWERICDYAKAHKNEVTMEFYYHSKEQFNDTAIAILGDVKVKSTLQDGMMYPNWHSVMPFYSKYQHLRLTPDGIKGLAQFIKNDKLDYPFFYTISVEAGTDELNISFTDYDFSKSKEGKFKLEQPVDSDVLFRASKKQMKKVQVEGIWFKESNSAVILDTKELDLMLTMPCAIDADEVNAPEPDEAETEASVEVAEYEEAIAA